MSVIRFKRRDEVFPDYWPSRPMLTVIAALLTNVSGRKGDHKYAYAFKVLFPGPVCRLTMQSGGALLHNPVDSESVFARWLRLNHIALNKLAVKRKKTTTLVGIPVEHDGTLTFCVYYLIEDGEITVDGPSIAEELEEADYMTVMSSTETCELTVNAEAGHYVCSAIDQLKEGYSALGIPVTRTTHGRLWATPIAMDMLSFVYKGSTVTKKRLIA